MGSLSSWLIVAHVIGLSLAVGSASAKLTLLAKCRTDHAFVPVFIAIARPVTRLIILGLILVTLSGVGWLLLGYPFTSTLIVKLVMVGVIWVLGPVIDNVAEPRFKKSAPAAGQSTLTVLSVVGVPTSGVESDIVGSWGSVWSRNI